jgi:hypothetical protein
VRYLSNDKKEFAVRRFDAVYKGFESSETLVSELTAERIDICYKRTARHIDWQSKSGAFSGFSLYKYLPAPCQDKKQHGQQSASAM